MSETEATPDPATPKSATPDPATPGSAAPGSATQGTAAPGSAAPGTATPSSPTPGTATPEPGAGESEAPGPSRGAVVAAAVLVGLLVVAVVVAGRVVGSGADLPVAAPLPTPAPVPRTGPVGLVPVEAPDASSAACASLVAELDGSLPNHGGTLERLPLADPAPAGAVAWGDRVGEPVVLRCGLAKPGELTPTSQLRVVSGVQWLPVEGDGASTWFAVDRGVYVALTMPTGVGTGPLQAVSEVVGRVLAVQQVRP